MTRDELGIVHAFLHRAEQSVGEQPGGEPASPHADVRAARLSAIGWLRERASREFERTGVIEEADAVTRKRGVKVVKLRCTVRTTVSEGPSNKFPII